MSDTGESTDQGVELEPLESEEVALAIARIANEKKAENLVALRARRATKFSAFFSFAIRAMASATSSLSSGSSSTP